MNECAICKKQKSLFELHTTADNGEEYTLYVCGTCWEVIAAIANKAMAERLTKIEERIDAIVPRPIDLDTITVESAKRTIATGKESKIVMALLEEEEAWDWDDDCGLRRDQFVCSRKKGHKGIHVAIDGVDVLCVWWDGAV